jgi:hypothetical protein
MSRKNERRETMPKQSNDDVKLLLKAPEKTLKVVLEGCSRAVVEEATKKFKEEYHVTAETGIMTSARKLYGNSEITTIYFNILQHKGKKACQKK